MNTKRGLMAIVFGLAGTIPLWITSCSLSFLQQLVPRPQDQPTLSRPQDDNAMPGDLAVSVRVSERIQFRTQATLSDVSTVDLSVEPASGSLQSLSLSASQLDSSGSVLAKFSSLYPGPATVSAAVLDPSARRIGEGRVSTFVESSRTSNISLAIALEPTYVFPGSVNASVSIGSGQVIKVAPESIQDPTLGPFSLLDSKLSKARTGLMTAVMGGYLYAMGGKDASGNVLASVERAALRPDGSIGQFQVAAGASLTTPRWWSSPVVLGDSLYLIGGSNSTGHLKSVERAMLKSDGSLGPFQEVPGVQLREARASATTLVVDNRLYVVGGRGVSPILASVESAQIGPDGSIGDLQVVEGVNLSASRYRHSSAATSKYLYVFGGRISDTFPGIVATTERAEITSDGSLRQFAADLGARMKKARNNFAALVVGKYIYVLGGHDDCCDPSILDSIERAKIASDGSLGAFESLQDLRLASPRSSFGLALVGNNLYAIGGDSEGLTVGGVNVGKPALDTVERASIVEASAGGDGM